MEWMLRSIQCNVQVEITSLRVRLRSIKADAEGQSSVSNGVLMLSLRSCSIASSTASWDGQCFVVCLLCCICHVYCTERCS